MDREIKLREVVMRKKKPPNNGGVWVFLAALLHLIDDLMKHYWK